ncbi:MAG: T9SS type A sorting domain-containing protein [Bacteroidia bacterium]|nr:T9SS type A sorting domain-containing protein [Bacteroidia bacterium]
MKNFAIFAFLLLCSSFLISQSLPLDPANGWYTADPSRTFIKLVVDQEGIYRVTANDLSNAGFSLAGADPANLHLYFRGVEQPLVVDATGSALNFLEFYGNKNDGVQDTLLYRNPLNGGLPDGSLSPDPAVSLFSDEAAYFLTWDNSPGLRYTDYFNGNYGSYVPESNFPFESKYTFLLSPASYVSGGGSQYDIFQSMNPDYVAGEGYVGDLFEPNAPVTLQVPTPLADMATAQTATVWARIFGRSSWQHVRRISAGATVLIQDTTQGIVIRSFDLSLTNNLTATTSLTFEAFGTQNNGTDVNHVTALSILYHRLPDLANAASLRISGFQNPSESYFSLANAPGSSTGWAYDWKNKVRSKGALNSGQLDLIVPSATQDRDLFVVTDNGLLSPLRIEDASLVNLSSATLAADFVIISSEALDASAQAYAAYRDTARGGLSVRVVHLDEIYDEFGYGSPTPLAIKRFCKVAYENWSQPPSTVLLWGKGSHLIRGQAATEVPTWGFPGNDHDFVSNFALAPPDFYPKMSVGRIPVTSDSEGMEYLAKVDEYEHTLWDPWMLNGLFMGGGPDTLEQVPIINYQADAISLFTSGNYGGTAYSFNKFNGSIVSNTSLTVDQVMQNGIAWAYLFGPSNPDSFDFVFKTPDQYANWGKYPVIVGMGNETAQFTRSAPGLAEKYLLEPGRGAIAYLGGTSYGYLSPEGDYGREYFENAFSQMTGEPLGSLQDSTAAQYLDFWHDQLHLNQVRQMVLLGDPAIVPYNPVNTNLQPGDGQNPLLLFPNPAADRVWLRFQVWKGGNGLIRMYDMLGRTLEPVGLGNLSAGIHTVEIPLQGLAAGAYFLSLEVNGVPRGFAKVVKE